jgi:hypothetical protein
MKESINLIITIQYHIFNPYNLLDAKANLFKLYKITNIFEKYTLNRHQVVEFLILLSN